MQHDLRWAQVTQKALTALGCLAVVLGEQKNLEQTDIRTLVASLEGMLKSTLQAETQLVMAEGKVLAIGAPAEVRANPAVIEAYLGH